MPAADAVTSLEEFARRGRIAQDAVDQLVPLAKAGGFTLVIAPIGEARESKLNPRQHFDPEKLKELATSIAAKGVLVPGIARPHPDGRGYELAAGHRRRRGAEMAKLAEFPLFVRNMTDEEFLEILTIENLQREDITPLEEARGFRQLLDRTKTDVPKVAAKIGKSREYVYARLKLLALAPEPIAALEKGELTPGHAILLARLVHDDQRSVLKIVREQSRFGGGMSVRQLTQVIDQQIKHRSGLEKAEEKLKDLERRGEKPLRISTQYGLRVDPGVLAAGQWWDAEKSDPGARAAVVVQGWEADMGKVRYVTTTAPAGRSIGGGSTDYGRQQRLREKKARRATEIRRRILEAAVAEVHRLDDQDLRAIAGAMWERLWHEHKKGIAKRRGWEAKKGRYGGQDWDGAGGREIAKMNGPELARFMLEVAFVTDTAVSVNASSMAETTPELTTFAKRHQVNPGAIVRAYEKEERVRNAKKRGGKKR